MPGRLTRPGASGPGLGSLRALVHGERPHPKLSLAEHGTRFPGALLAALGGEIRTLPDRFTLQAYRDGLGELRFPLARGPISWVRRADEDGHLALLGHRLRLGAARRTST